jgi:hypothetical protein
MISAVNVCCHTRVGGPQSRSGSSKKEKNLFFLPEVEKQFFGQPGLSLDSILPVRHPTSKSVFYSKTKYRARVVNTFS